MPIRGRSKTSPEANGGNDAVKEWHSEARRALVSVGLFSLLVNILMLTLPLYLFQLSDRVLTSHSLNTLVMLSIVTIGFMSLLSVVYILRRQILNRLATRFETSLGGSVLASIVTNAKVSDSANKIGR